MVANFVEWLRPKLEDGSYVGWLASRMAVWWPARDFG